MYILLIFLFVLVLVCCSLKSKIEQFDILKIPEKYKIRREKCLDYCDEKSCLRMFQMQKQLKECLDCRKKGGCYQKNLVEPSCNVCLGENDSTDCYSIFNYGCKNPDNLSDFKGVNPYYILTDSDGYTYTKECKFCWNI